MKEFTRKESLKAQTLLDRGVESLEVKIVSVDTRIYDDGKKPFLSILVGEEAFVWTANKVNTEKLIEKFGEESNDWIGKTFTLRLEETDGRGGGRVRCLRVM